MLWSGTLLKGGLNIPQFPLGPRCHGRVGQKMSCKFFSISTYDYIRNTCLHYMMNWSQFCVTLCYDCYMMNRIRHNSPSPIQCLRISLTLFLLIYYYYCYYCTCYKIIAITVTITIVTTKLPLLSSLLHLLQNYCYHCYYYYCCCHHYQNYHITLLLITLLQIINLQVWLN